MANEILQDSLLYQINQNNQIDNSQPAEFERKRSFIKSLKLAGAGRLSRDETRKVRVQAKQILTSGRFNEQEIKSMSKSIFQVMSFFVEGESRSGRALISYFLRKKYVNGKVPPGEDFNRFMTFVFGSDYYPR